jgi:hypothetical protein
MPFDFDGYKRAFTSQDVDAWLTYYAPDAQWTEYRHSSPPRAPHRMSGREEIGRFLRAVKASDVTLEISDEVLGPTRAAFCVVCTLPDGVRRIIEHVIVHHEGGVIRRQVDVEAWD